MSGELPSRRPPRRGRLAVRYPREVLLAVAALLGLLGGGALHLLGIDRPAHLLWAGTTALLLVPLTVSVVRSLLRRDVGVDAIALISMAGALALGEYLAGAVIALMLAGGNALEARANGRAKRELSALVQRAPRTALVRRSAELVEVPVDSVEVGQVVLVRAGEVVPVDGLVESEEAVVDESALTGEPLPVTIHRGGQVRSGVASAGGAFELRAVRPAAESAYAAIVRLVIQAGRERAPFVRLADRYAAFFLPATTAVAALAWIFSGDPVRALAVFVVATPCPLILAAPIALISGLSRAARAGVVVKGGGALERLGAARTVLLDKTGTITLGQPEVARIASLNGLPPDDTLRLAASLEQLSAHPLASALVAEAKARGLQLSLPDDTHESFGHGIEGTVDGRKVLVGSRHWLRAHGVDPALPAELDAEAARVLVSVDGGIAGVALLEDRLREDAGDLVTRLRKAGIDHVAIVSGDKAGVTERVGRALGVDRVYAEQTPEEKVAVVRALREQPNLRNVVMVGDGVNDAPALALADVGIAMGTIGATVASDTADAIVIVERVDRVADAVSIAHRSLGIARQSVLLGISASLIAMGFAAFGFLAPVTGALLQEAIDVGVILNALRALGGSRP
jgi:heavy metal translocating P-type ATPase